MVAPTAAKAEISAGFDSDSDDSLDCIIETVSKDGMRPSTECSTVGDTTIEP